MSLSFESDLVADDSTTPQASAAFLRVLGIIFSILTVTFILLRLAAAPGTDVHGPPPQINKPWLIVNFISFVLFFTALPIVVCGVLAAVSERCLHHRKYNFASVLLEWLVVLNYMGGAPITSQIRARVLLAGCYLELGRVSNAVLALRWARHDRRSFIDRMKRMARFTKIPGVLEATESKADDVLAGTTGATFLETSELMISIGRSRQALPLRVEAINDLQHYRRLIVRKATIEEMREAKHDFPRWMMVAESLSPASKIHCIDKAIRDLSTP